MTPRGRVIFMLHTRKALGSNFIQRLVRLNDMFHCFTQCLTASVPQFRRSQALHKVSNEFLTGHFNTQRYEVSAADSFGI